MSTGVFITFEGIDGCGKSTQLKAVAQYLENKHIPHIVTREPGGTPLAEKIRELLLNPAHTTMAWKTELLLYAAARAQHLQEKIIPALHQGLIILCDRYYDATLAYQGYGRGLDTHMIIDLHRITTSDLNPQLTFIFDLPVTIATTRMVTRNNKKDRMENEASSFQERVREGYIAIARQHTQRCHLIDATPAPAIITKNILPILDKHL